MRSSVLEGTRVLDFTWSVAGPTITTYLASLGAEVIKVEWPARPDMMRTTMFAKDIEPTLDSGCFYAAVNPGKLGLSLDARSTEGHRLVEQLIAQADMVTESFSAGVMERWGFTYQRMTELRPDLIYLSLSGFGHNGRYRTYDTWGPTAQSFNGLTSLSGLPGYPPAGWGFSYMDIMAGYTATVAALMALYHRKRTGQGQYIDIAQVETGLALNGSAILDASVNLRGGGRVGVPPGNRSAWPGATAAIGLRGEVGAPYNCYPTAGGGRFDYCAITVLSEDQWNALKQAMGSPTWAEEARFATAASRISNQDALDAHLVVWTSQQEKTELMLKLQAAGVPCGALQSMEDLVERDPQLQHRAMFIEAQHPLLGMRHWQNVPFTLSDSPACVSPRWPLLGQDNAYVLGELLGLNAEEIENLDAAGVTWPKDMPRTVKIENALW